jgi:hypothetical protein
MTKDPLLDELERAILALSAIRELCVEISRNRDTSDEVLHIAIDVAGDAYENRMMLNLIRHRWDTLSQKGKEKVRGLDAKLRQVLVNMTLVSRDAGLV